MRWLGIDFFLRIHDVRPVQELAGSGAPFDRLVALLSGAD